MNDGSDQDEGFVANKLQIKNKTPVITNKTPALLSKSPQLNLDFQTRYLSGDGILWKQPEQAYETFQQCPIVTSQDNKHPKVKKNKLNNQPCHPYKLYTINPQYKLIYFKKRGQPFLQNQCNFAKNQIIMMHLAKPSTQNYRNLKQFTFNQNQQFSNEYLQIDSKFECGNLYCAYKHHNTHEYILFIQNDTNTFGYNQWFYFSIKNAKTNINYKFKIVNLKKKHSLFKYGYKLAIFSLKRSMENSGWYRGGQNISYDDSPICDPDNRLLKYYCLSFQFKPNYENDYITISMGLPYSYSRLIRNINIFSKEAQAIGINWETNAVIYSLTGNAVPQITITTNKKPKNAIIFLARQHPGQTWSSYLIEFMMKQLISGSQQSKWLLQNYLIKIYPMINVDGVIYGNFRCDISGVDMNRRWKQPSPLLHPQISEIKKRIIQLKKSYKIDCCLDLHGHSKDYNIFAYSCKDNMYSCRLLPYLIHKKNPIFYFPSCTFGISRYKQSTARATVYNIIKNQNVLTIETSFYGWKKQGIIQHFQPKHINQMAASIISALRDFLDKRNPRRQAAERQIRQKIKQLQTYQQITQQQSGSQSQPQADQMQFSLKVQRIFPKKFASQQKYFLHQQKIRISPQKNKTLAINQKTSQISQIMNIKKIIKKLPTSKLDIQQIKSKKSIQKPIRENKKTQVQSKSIKRQSQKVDKTISYSQNSKYSRKRDLQIIAPQRSIKLRNTSNSIFRKKRKIFSITMKQPQPNKDTLLIQSKKQTSQKLLQLQILNKSGQMIKQYDKFITSPKKKKNSNLNLLQQSLFNQDQSQMLNVLLNNKRMLELERIKRDIQRSTGIAERQGKLKSNSKDRKNSIIDFRKFKDNQKINFQIKRMIENNSRYIGGYPNAWPIGYPSTN